MTLYELFINPHDQDGTTPFNSAAQEGHTEVIKFLLDKGANIEAKSPVSCTISHTSSFALLCFTSSNILLLYLHYFLLRMIRMVKRHCIRRF
jgi:ankyrin repeat protein